MQETRDERPALDSRPFRFTEFLPFSLQIPVDVPRKDSKLIRAQIDRLFLHAIDDHLLQKTALFALRAQSPEA
jgi:hypothetical protein